MSDELARVVSADGTTLSARVTGHGPPLVLVHGTTGTMDAWALVEPLLAEHHTVWSYDRRGRGQSGDADTYAFAREVEDVCAVVAAAGDGVHLVGHSFGAYCSLDAAAFDIGLASLTLYEPPVHAERRAEAVQRAVGRLEAEDYEGALLIFLPEVAGLSDDEVSMVQSIPEVWSSFLEVAPTCRREFAALDAHSWNPLGYGSVDVPTLQISGSLTRSPVYLSRAELLEVIPQAAHVVLEGQRHIAMVTDPEQLTRVVLDFTSPQGGG